MDVRRAGPGELAAVMSVLDAGLLETALEEVREGIDAGRVLVALEGERVLGAVLLDDEIPTAGARIEAVAVRRRRRGQGIGSELIGAAAEEYGRLVAEFDADVRPFWEAVGFEVDRASRPGRYVGWLDERPG